MYRINLNAFPRIIYLLVIVATVGGCKNHSATTLDAFSRAQLVQWNKALTQVIITDVLTPPVCSRVYAYANIAAYETLCKGSVNNESYANRLNGLTIVPSPEGSLTEYSLSVASMIAFSAVAQKMVFNSEAVMDLEETYLNKLVEFGIEENKLSRSITYGQTVGRYIIEWAASDGYLERTANPAFMVTKEQGRWVPTPPDYADAIEPNWHTLRPFSLDSVAQFRPPAPPAFDTARNSDYFKQLMAVYEAVTKPGPDFVKAAEFWDCNPNISVTQGHVTYFQQKISPAGHWMHVAANVCDKEKFTELKTAGILSRLAISMADGFMSCWEAKFHYNTVRPETMINRLIDQDWRPLLQTPPFPEYPSGHSVISGAASSVLTSLIGDNYHYIDSTEVPFGMPARNYTSFNQAAAEASISRLYGGIHYLPALNNGLAEGRNISNYVLTKLK